MRVRLRQKADAQVVRRVIRVVLARKVRERRADQRSSVDLAVCGRCSLVAPPAPPALLAAVRLQPRPMGGAVLGCVRTPIMSQYAMCIST